MKNTSRVERFSRIDPSAPWWSMAGPELTLMATPSSLAMMCASVVLPRPGGPHRSTCSTGSRQHRQGLFRVELRLELDDHLRRGALPDAAGSADRRRIFRGDRPFEDLDARRAQDVETDLRAYPVDADEHLEQLELFRGAEPI